MTTTAVFAREDTLLGVCFALGEDFGFSPTPLRILFGLALFWSPTVAVSAYLAAGALVALSRRLFPDPAPAVAEAPEAEGVEELRLAA